MDVRIFRPARTAMQSGIANTKEWVVQFEPSAPRSINPLMGWTSSPDTRGQVRLCFSTKEEAIAYAEKQGYAYQVLEPKERTLRPKSYATNFDYRRVT